MTAASLYAHKPIPQQRISATWRGQQLGTIVSRLADTQGISIWLDRRIDLQQEINLRVADTSVLQALTLLSEQQAMGVTVLDTVIYVGPKAAAQELQTLSQLANAQLSKASKETKKYWHRSTPWQCENLSNPRTLLVAMLHDANIEIAGENLIPHDLWAAKQLPPLSLVDRVVLILAGFDLTCDISQDSKRCEVTPIERPVVIERKYRLPKNAKPSFTQLQKSAPNGSFVATEKSFSFTGRWEEHQRIQELLNMRTTPKRQPSRRPATKAERKFSLQLENQPVGTVINQLAKQLRLEVQWDEASLTKAGISRDAPVSCRVKNASLDELLESILAPVGLYCDRKAKRVEIRARE